MDKYQSSANSSIGHGGGGGGWGRRGRPMQKPHDFRGTMKMLWNAMAGLRGWLLLIAAIAMTVSGASVIIPLLSGSIIDACGTGPGEVRFPMLRHFVLLLAAVYGADVCLIFLREFLMAGLSQRFVNRLRRDMFAKLQKLPLGFFDSHESGDLMSRLTNDMDTISGSVGQAAIQLITGVLTVTGTLVAMVVKSPLLALTVLVTVPLIYILTRTVTKHTGPMFKRQQAALGMLNAHIEDYLNFEDTIKLYDWGFSDFSYRNVVDTQTPVYELDVELAENDAKAVLYPTERIRLLLPRDTSDEDIHLDYTIYNTELRAPVKAGEVLGEAVVSVNGEVYGTVSLVTKEAVDLARSQYMKQQLATFFTNRWVIGITVVILLTAALYITLRIRYRKAREQYMEERRQAEIRRRKRQKELEEKRREGWDL